MNFTTAYLIFHHINDEQFTDEEKAEAIKIVMQFETFNSVTKKAMIEVIRWLISKYITK